MKPIKDIDSDNNNVSLPETIEDKLNKAEKRLRRRKNSYWRRNMGNV